ncbi:MAG TPA: hypothetical protein VJV22_02915, partial [Acidobacteriaceae bacterium]|nr:hypothetical protein [Acidobacteriaceae bacterium]
MKAYPGFESLSLRHNAFMRNGINFHLTHLFVPEATAVRRIVMLPVVSVFSRPELTKFGAAGSKSS